MRLFEIVEGDKFHETLEALHLKEYEKEEMREALDWKLSRKPESGQKVNTGPITIFLELYLLPPDKYVLITYRIEGEKVILEEVHVDRSQQFLQ